MNLKEYDTMAQEVLGLRQLAASLSKKLTPQLSNEKGVCVALDEHDSSCNHHPDYELFIPSLSPNSFILCSQHKIYISLALKMLGIFFQELEHIYPTKQKSLF